MTGSSVAPIVQFLTISGQSGIVSPDYGFCRHPLTDCIIPFVWGGVKMTQGRYRMPVPWNGVEIQYNG